MESLFGISMEPIFWVFLIGSLFLALCFEFVNGFHDTANAVATVIYTHTLKPGTAVVWSGIWNFLGVVVSTGAVAYGIVSLLPVELIVNVGSGAGFAMVFALLLSAIIWNVGTWYFGLPASSSHTLIGSIVGVGLANAWMSYHLFGEGVNWGKVRDVGMSLLISPLVGFCFAALLLFLAKKLIRNPALYEAPEGDKPPPLWIRALLILTCTGVSFAHGSNDGQKGMGLIMLILIGVVPAVFALNPETKPQAIAEMVSLTKNVAGIFDRNAKAIPPLAMTEDKGIDNITLMSNAQAEEMSVKPKANPLTPAKTSKMPPNQTLLSNYLRTGKANNQTYAALAAESIAISTTLANAGDINTVPLETRKTLRSDMYLVAESIGKMLKKEDNPFRPDERALLDKFKKQIQGITNFIPTWVKIAVAIALGLGTTIGWKRIVVTVGEKIGKSHLTYAQGASAELVAMSTIGAADLMGLPVSTTHVLSSGVAGTMFANQSGLQQATLRNLLLAWVLTLPVCVFLGATLFAAGIYIVIRMGM